MKATKRITALFLSVALLVSFAPQTTVSAATKTQKSTLMAGEVVSYSSYFGTIKSVSSNKKAVATVKKKDGKAVVTTKKAGKVTITIKTTRGTNKIKVTVKKASFNCSIKDLSNGTALVCVKNNSSIFIDNTTVSYTLKSPEGETLYQDTCTVNDLMPGQTSYARVYYDTDATISPENSSAYVNAKTNYRSLSAKYKAKTSTTKVTVTEEDKANGKLVYKAKNNYSGSVNGVIDFFFYDATGNLINYTSRSLYLKGKSLETKDVSIYTEYDHYEMSVRAYSKIF